MTRIQGAILLILAFALPTMAHSTSNRTTEIDSGPLLTDYPKVRILRDETAGLTSVFGTRMTAASSPVEAVTTWLNLYAESLGMVGLHVGDTVDHMIGHGPLRVVALTQVIDDITVINTLARFVTLQVADQHFVVYVGTRLAAEPLVALRRAPMPSAKLQPNFAALLEANHLTAYSAPQLAILFEEKGLVLPNPILTWRVMASSDDQDSPAAYSIHLDASNGRLVSMRDELQSADHNLHLRGSVTGFASAGTFPDTALHPPAMQAIPDTHIFTDLGDTTYTNSIGVFAFDIELPELRTLHADFQGQWFLIDDATMDNLTFTGVIDPTSPRMNILFNEPPASGTTAQINAFLHTNRARSLFRGHQPDFPELDVITNCRVNIGGGRTCGGGFDPMTGNLLFTAESPQCVNTAYSTVLTHEFAHLALNRLALPAPQGPFGEGFADAYSLLVFDNPVVGQDFYGPGTFVRDIATANEQFPCDIGDHYCGQVLAGVWWDIKQHLQQKLGDDEGLQTARQLLTDWSRIATGGSGLDGVHPLSPIEVLTIADDDGEFDTLTPFFNEICTGFALHNLDCPIADCNDNGVDDRTDVAEGTSDDCTDNGIPDECELDCNGNGVADSCDLAEGTPDEDGNGIPDSCQQTRLVPGTSYQTIQAAIDDANPGDTVRVASGTYRGDGNKNLDLQGKILLLQCETPRGCIIDCENDGRGFYIHLDETPATVIDGFVVTHGLPNDALLDGGGVYCADSSPTFRRCTIHNCRTTQAGGGIWIRFGDPVFEDSLITNNNARTGGGFAIARSATLIRRCTIASNTATSGSAFAAQIQGSASIDSSIIWGHSPASNSGITDPQQSLQVRYSLVEHGRIGIGNISGDPFFTDPAHQDYHLIPGSPCVNTGDPETDARNQLDADGLPRHIGCRIDMGAFETNHLQDSADFDDTGSVTLKDFAWFQTCFDAARLSPTLNETCKCVFDLDATDSLDLMDHQQLLNLLMGP